MTHPSRQSTAALRRRLGDFVERRLWEIDPASRGPARGAGIIALRVVVLVGQGLGRHQLWLRSAALTYVTVFGLVPIIAVGFAMFKAFGGLDDATEILLPRILDYLTVGTREAVEQRIREFIANVHGGALGGVGGLFLGLSAISLLTNVERALNGIWGVERPRNLAQRMTTYWTLATVTPALLVAGITLPRALRRVPAFAWLLEHTGTGSLVFGVIVPLLFVWGGFALTYAVMPNTRVRPAAALIGGVAGGSLFAIAAKGYAVYAARAVQYSTIYGSLGVIPLFLLWLNLTWVLVLVGAEVACAADRLDTHTDEALARDASQTARQVLTLRALCDIARGFTAGTPPTTVEVARALGAPAGLVRAIVAELIGAELLYRTGDEERLVPARDPRQLHPADVLRALRDRGRTAELLHTDPETQNLLASVDASDRAARQAWREPSIAELALAGTA